MTPLDVKRAAVVAQQATDGLADDVDQVKRSWSPNHIDARLTYLNIRIGNQLRQELRGWLSSPDPSINHNIACNIHHEGTANWFFQGRFYNEWKSIGSDSLLWVHGKRAFLSC